MAFATAEARGIALQIPRNSLALLMLAQLVVVLPLTPYISPWIVGVCAFCGVWRWRVFQGRHGFPPSLVKVFLVIASVVGLALSGYDTFSLEAATSLLVVAFALKLVEMKSRRDAYVIIYLSYFLVATGFLFSQTIGLAAYELTAAIVVTSAMVGMNQLHTRVRPLASLQTAAVLILQALPLTIVLFLLFPRIGPLWSIPVHSSASTGLSDTVKPGDVASLSRSDELAFRVVFDGSVPEQRDLYWRGLVYSEFEQGAWSVGESLDPIDIPDLPRAQPGLNGIYDYEIFLEPTQTEWLYALHTPVTLPRRAELLEDYRMVNDTPVISILRYRVESDQRVVNGLFLEPEMRERELRLPEGESPRIRTWAAELARQYDDPRRIVGAMLRHIRNEPFSYTLRPPALPDENSIDAFWFDTRRGFCTHYAGAVVFALRSIGIPARMVGGYQGGEMNPVTGHMVVRQYDAHAWMEVWYEGIGWMRYDPTGAVAPARVEQGLNAALSSSERAELSFLSNARQSGDSNLLQDMLQFADSLEHRWNLWVVGYDTATQSSVLKKLLGDITPGRVAAALLAGCGASMLMVAAAIFWRRRGASRHKLERQFTSFCQAFRGTPMQREGHESPAAYLTRLGQATGVDTSELAAQLQSSLYDPEQAADFWERQQLRRALHTLRFKLLFQRA